MQWDTCLFGLIRRILGVNKCFSPRIFKTYHIFREFEFRAPRPVLKRCKKREEGSFLWRQFLASKGGGGFQKVFWRRRMQRREIKGLVWKNDSGVFLLLLLLLLMLGTIICRRTRTDLAHRSLKKQTSHFSSTFRTTFDIFSQTT